MDFFSPPLLPSFDYPSYLVVIFLYFHTESDEVQLKIILESLIHINALNRMEINLLC